MADITLASLATLTASATGDALDTSNVALLRQTLTADSGDTAGRGVATLPKRFACIIETREAGGAWRTLHRFTEADRITSGAGASSLYGLSGFPVGRFRAVVAPDDETRCRFEIERGDVPGHVKSPELYGSIACSVIGTSVEGA